MFSYVLLSHLLEFFPSQIVSLQSCTDYYVPAPPNHLHQPYWLAPCYWELIITHTLPYINSILGQPAFFLDSWPLNKGPISCAEMLVRNYPPHCVITQNSAILMYFVAEAWNHARIHCCHSHPTSLISLQLTFLEVSLKGHWFELVWKMQETLHIVFHLISLIMFLTRLIW